jgi:threonine synthase
VAVSDEEIMDALQHWARVEGVFAAPEGAAALAAYRKLRSSQFFKDSDRVVLFNTGAGLKYLDTLDTKCVERTNLPTSRQIAGIIGPY